MKDCKVLWSFRASAIVKDPTFVFDLVRTTCPSVFFEQEPTAKLIKSATQLYDKLTKGYRLEPQKKKNEESIMTSRNSNTQT